MKKIPVFILTLALSLVAANAFAANFGLNPSTGEDTVYFRSQAKLEFIEGKTNLIEGSFQASPDSLSGQVGGTLRVDLRTLKTWIDMRDEHMRERHLQTDSFPYAYFQITGITGLPSQLPVGQLAKGTATGMFYIHGGKRKIEAILEVTRVKGGGGDETLAIRTKFTLHLDDYGIPRPKALFLKLAEAVDIEVIFSGHNNLGSANLTLPDWPERK